MASATIKRQDGAVALVTVYENYPLDEEETKHNYFVSTVVCQIRFHVAEKPISLIPPTWFDFHL